MRCECRWGLSYLCYFRTIRAASSKTLELYWKYLVRNIFKYFKMGSCSSYTDTCGPQRRKEGYSTSFSSSCMHLYTACCQSWLGEFTIVTGKNKSEKWRTCCKGKKKISDQWCFITLLRKYITGQIREGAIQTNKKIRGGKDREQRLQHINLHQTFVQLITLGTY